MCPARCQMSGANVSNRFHPSRFRLSGTTRMTCIPRFRAKQRSAKKMPRRWKKRCISSAASGRHGDRPAEPPSKFRNNRRRGLLFMGAIEPVRACWRRMGNANESASAGAFRGNAKKADPKTLRVFGSASLLFRRFPHFKPVRQDDDMVVNFLLVHVLRQ